MPFRLLLPALILALAASCGTSTRDGVSGPEITAPPAVDVEAEEEAGRDLDESARAVAEESAGLRDRVRDLRREAADANREAETVGSELDRLVEQKSATEAELIGLREMFGEVRARNVFLEEDLAAAERSTDVLREAVVRHEEARDDQAVRIMRILGESAAKDRVIEDLQRQAVEHRGEIERLSLEKNRRAVGEAEEKGAGGVYSTFVWYAVGFVSLLGVGVLVWKLVVPRVWPGG